MSIVAVDGERGLALCEDDEGRRQTVETALIDPVNPGERLLVHAGTAIAHLGAEALA